MMENKKVIIAVILVGIGISALIIPVVLKLYSYSYEPLTLQKADLLDRHNLKDVYTTSDLYIPQGEPSKDLLLFETVLLSESNIQLGGGLKPYEVNAMINYYFSALLDMYEDQWGVETKNKLLRILNNISFKYKTDFKPFEYFFRDLIIKPLLTKEDVKDILDALEDKLYPIIINEQQIYNTMKQEPEMFYYMWNKYNGHMTLGDRFNIFFDMLTKDKYDYVFEELKIHYKNNNFYALFTIDLGGPVERSEAYQDNIFARQAIDTARMFDILYTLDTIEIP